LADELIEIDPPGDHVAPKDRRRLVPDVEFRAQLLIDLVGEEGELPFVVGLEIEEAVPLDAASGKDAKLGAFYHRMLAGRLFVMAEEIVPGRDVEVFDANISRDHRR